MFQVLRMPLPLGEARDVHREKSYITRILAIDSLDGSTLYLQAQIYAKLGFYDSAIAVLTKGLDEHLPLASRWLMFRGALYENRQQQPAAYADYARIKAIARQMQDTASNTISRGNALCSLHFVNMMMGAGKSEELIVYKAEAIKAGISPTDKTFLDGQKILMLFNKERFLADFKRGNL
ncbi:tetratricopeptide repeat protein [Deminuibacter soli]|uniref:tetratricopeptide repeat protein n=1 Tax=Deminuibacter soli TaxID=2291815 RepID=UPI0011C19E0D|nr:hypothetical protein [Deminuibacter soli]